MPALENSEVWRGGRTSPTISQEKHIGDADRVEVWNGHALPRRHEKGIHLKFSVASKGGGVTDLYIFVPETDFATIEQVMATARADPRRL